MLDDFEICRSKAVPEVEDLMLDKSEDEEIVEIDNSLDNLVCLPNENLNEANL